MGNNKVKKCACTRQIVWFLDNNGAGSILACKNCEITFYYSHENCPHCGEEITEFVEKSKH
jgi:uncharacterized OB-fold protein